MRRYLGVLVATVLLSTAAGSVRAGGDDAEAILDKAINALGGEEKLRNIAAFTWTARAAVKANGKVTESVSVAIYKGLSQMRRDFKTRSPFRVILDGDKGWMASGGKYVLMNKDSVEKQKRSIYLQVIPTLLVSLKSRGFQYEAAGTEEVRGKPAWILKVIGPDRKDFSLSFDKENYLPVKEVARSLRPDGKEQVEETFFGDYKDFGGIKKATAIESKTDAENYGYFEITDFKVLDRVPSNTFAPSP
jgi:hypothetical protein